jgi:hypothetical protein
VIASHVLEKVQLLFEPVLDLDATLVGNETSVTRSATGCNAFGSSELWTITNGLHVPDLSSSFSREVIEHLFAHPKLAPAVPALAPTGWLLLGGLLIAFAWRKVVHEKGAPSRA